MNIYKRLLTFTLALAIVLPSAITPTLASSQPKRQFQSKQTVPPREAITNQTPKATYEQVKQPQVTAPVEIESKRTASTEVFMNPDGTKTMTVYANPIHYPVQENSQTTWKNIDSNLKKTDTGYQNTANSFSVHLPNELTKSAITLNKNNLQIKLSLQNNDKSSSFSSGLLPNLLSPKLNVKGSNITYGNVFTGVDFSYQSLDQGLKEEIILNSPNAQSSFVFDLQTTGVTAQKQGDGSILFIDNQTNKTEFLMPKMVMWDQRGGKDSESNAESEDIAVDLVPLPSGYRLTVLPSTKWLKDRTRVYPVIVDPTIIVDLLHGEDSYVEQNFPTTKTHNQKNLYVGRHTAGLYPKGIVRTLIPFSIPDLTDANIINAKFTVRQKQCAGACSTTGITANLTTHYDPYNVDWNNQPSFIGEVGYRYGNGGPNYLMNVTAALKHWYEERNPSGSKVGSLGFRFDTESRIGYQIWTAENDPDSTRDQEPRLTINYRDYYAEYSLAPLPNLIINQYFNENKGAVTNSGRNTWSASNVHLSYHVYDSLDRLVTWDGERTVLPRDVAPHGDYVELYPNIKAPSTPGDYTIKWDMVQEGVTWFSEQGVPTFNQPLHVNDEPEYNAQYEIPVATGSLVEQDYIISDVTIRNTGRKSWSATDTHLSYHIYDTSGNLITFDGVRTLLPRDVAGRGDSVVLDAKYKAPSAPGDYTIKWDMVQEAVTWFSDKGVPTLNNPLRVDDFPLYAARYNIFSPPPPTALSNSTITIPMSVTNLSRQTWEVDAVQVAYHWIDNASGATYIYNGTPRKSFAAPVARRNGTGSVVLNVKAPLNAGSYTLKIDMVDSSTWFSEKGVPTADYTVTITNPAFSSSVHLGSEKYYTKAGPIDLATGNLAYSSVDMTVPSNSGLLAVGRSYNSTTYDNKYSLDSNGYIHNWVINGPYRENDQSLRLSRAFIPVEANAQPSPGSISANNLWVYASSSSPVFDINATLAEIGSVEQGYGNNATAYMHAYVYSPTNKTYTLKVGSADGVKVWVNGSVVLNNNVLRAHTLDSDTVEASFNQGWNRVMFKIAHASSQWALSVRLLNTDLTVPSDLIISSGNQDTFVTTSTMGLGWRTSFDESLNTLDIDNVFYQDGTGAVDIFTRNGDASYNRPAGVAIDLVKNIDDTFTVKSKSGLKTNFSNTGLLLNRVDLSGNIITYVRDANGNVTSITDGTRIVTLAYTGSRLDSVSNQLGQTISYTYDMTKTPFRLIKVTDPLAGSYTYEYTVAGKLSKFIDKNANPITVSYDLNNRVVEIKDALASTGKIVYNDKFVTVTDPLNQTSQLTFDNNYLMIDFTNPKGYREIYTNDGNYNVVTATPDLPENEYYYYKYTNTYDANDNLLVAKDPMDNTTSNEYVRNDLVKTTDPKGNVTTNTYSTDGRRLLLSQKDANLNVDSFTYNAKGRKITSTDSKGAPTQYTYTASSDVASLVSPKSETTQFSYDSIGRKVSEKSPLGNTIAYGYDSMGRLTSLTDAGGLVSRYEYDKNSNKTKEIDPKGNAKSYEYDVLNRQTKVIDEAGATVTQAYDLGGNVTSVVDAKGKATTFNYDVLGQVVKQTDPIGNIATIDYDRNGNAVKVTDPLGNVATQATDKTGKSTSVVNKEGTTTMAYDKNSNLISSNSTVQSENVALLYDKVDNLTSLQSSVAGNTAIAYDKNDNPTSSAVSTATISTTYDANTAVKQISTNIIENGQTLTNILVKDAEGKLVSAKNPNGDTISYTYDLSGRVTKVLNKYKLGATLEQINYTYDAASNIVSALDSTTGNTTYTYDARNQLLTENGTAYTYDVMGNRKSKLSSSENITYTYDELGDANRLLKTKDTSLGSYFPVETTYEYDNNGNTIKKVSGSNGTTQYFYDSDNYFIKAILPNGTIVEYTYDKLAKLRISRTVTKVGGAPTTLKYVYDGDKLVSETKLDGKIVRSYTWDEDENLLSVTMPDTEGVLQTFYYLKNGHSDITGLTDASGSKFAAYDYDAWGNVTNSKSLLPWPRFYDPDSTSGETITLDQMNPRRYAGYWYDTALGLYFMKARMYDSVLGRFLSEDPITSGNTALDANPYLYCANSPLTRIDPSGKVIFLAALVMYSIIAVTAYYSYKDVKTLASPSSSKLDKGVSAGSLLLNLLPVATGAKVVVGTTKVVVSTTKAVGKTVASNGAKTTAKKKGTNYVIRDGIAVQSHHIDPIVAGGAKRALRAIIPVTLHQDITNYTRELIGYGSVAAIRFKKMAIGTPEERAERMREVGEIMKKVYDRYPITGFPTEFR